MTNRSTYDDYLVICEKMNIDPKPFQRWLIEEKQEKPRKRLSKNEMKKLESCWTVKDLYELWLEIFEPETLRTKRGKLRDLRKTKPDTTFQRLWREHESEMRKFGFVLAENNWTGKLEAQLWTKPGTIAKVKPEKKEDDNTTTFNPMDW